MLNNFDAPGAESHPSTSVIREQGVNNVTSKILPCCVRHGRTRRYEADDAEVPSMDVSHRCLSSVD
jgi:hypothetical protein